MTATENGTPKTWEDVLAILDTQGPELHPVVCPELGGITVQVRALTREEVLRINRATDLGNNKQDTTRADQMMFLFGVVDPRPTEQQYAHLKKSPKASIALSRIHSKIGELSGLRRTENAWQEEDTDNALLNAESYLKSTP